MLIMAGGGNGTPLALGWSSRAFDDLVYKSPRSQFLDSVEQRTQLSTWLSPLPASRRSLDHGIAQPRHAVATSRQAWRGRTGVGHGVNSLVVPKS
jgi:hypothetical protein